MKWCDITYLADGLSCEVRFDSPAKPYPKNPLITLSGEIYCPFPGAFPILGMGDKAANPPQYALVIFK
jgi:hypothetical protein